MRYWILLFVFYTLSIVNLKSQNAPTIDIWYGTDQVYGSVGIPQYYFNILGNVSDNDGIKSIGYILNANDTVFINVGPDDRRLQNEGDFNIDIHQDDLNSGNNSVLIVAKDNNDNVSTSTVSVNYQPGNTWDINYGINWDTVTNIQNVSQVVDGKWSITPDGVRTLEPGYDRLLCIGDITWTNYEVTIPIKLHDFHTPVGPLSGSTHDVGLLLRWTGHTDTPASGWQPKSGWEPLGDILWFKWKSNDTINAKIDIWYGDEIPFTFDRNKSYLLKARVVTQADGKHFYSAKAWEEGTTEPVVWNISHLRESMEKSNGSLNLIAHHIDATFGDIEIKPLISANFPVSSFVYVVDPQNSFKISFDGSGSSDPNNDIIGYYWDFGDGTKAQGTTANHTYSQEGCYDASLTVIDADNNHNILTQKVFVSDYEESNIQSDDFNKSDIDGDRWTFVNPRNDGSYRISGFNTDAASLVLEVPAGIAHDVWSDGNNAVRVVQSCNSANFQMEAKYLSEVTQQFQLQGLLAEQDQSNYIRYDFYSDGNDTHIFGAKIVGGTASVIFDEILNFSSYDSSYLRLSKIGECWNFEYKVTNQPWKIAGTHVLNLSVSSVGIIAGNAGSQPPKFDAIIDYFFNTSAPIDPEDGSVAFPFAQFTYSINSEDPLKVNFDASDSYDPDGEISSYSWEFGDGSIGSGKVVEHKYSNSGKYTVTLKVIDSDNNESTKSIEIELNPITSDDFNSESLNEQLWEFINPKDDGSYQLNGFGTDEATISIVLPGGTEHDIVDNDNSSVRLMQSASDTDFEVEIKFFSTVNKQFQSQGIMVEDNTKNFLRFDLFSDGSNIHHYAAKFVNGISTTIEDNIISANNENLLFLKIKREGNNWIAEYSYDGSLWENAIAFTHEISVKKIGFFALNAGNNAPDHTAIIDYFFNTTSPIVPEDGEQTIITGLDELGDINVKMYPNPADSYVILKSLVDDSSIEGVHIFDGRGKLVHQLNKKDLHFGNQDLKLNTSSLESGLYITKVFYSNASRTTSSQILKLFVSH